MTEETKVPDLTGPVSVEVPKVDPEVSKTVEEETVKSTSELSRERRLRNRHVRRTPFYRDTPVFVKIPFNANGRRWVRGVEFPWLTLGIKEVRVATLYNQNKLMHNEALEANLPDVGDGLDQMNMEELSNLVSAINEKVKLATKTKTEFGKKKCKISRVHAKQIGLIRRWRSNFGTIETQ